MMGVGARAAGLLLAAGFMGGFFLSAGAGRLLIRPSAAAPQRAGEPAGPPSAAAPAGGGNGKRGGLAQGGGTERGGGTGQDSGGASRSAPAPQRVARGGGGDDGVAPQDDAAEEASAPRPDDGRSFLAGNTLLSTDRDGVTRIRYLSRRGWQEARDPTGLVARRWTMHSGQFCLLTMADNISCEAMTIAREKAPDARIGAVLGSVAFGTAGRWTIVRGNPKGLPETVPLIDGERGGRAEPLPGKPSARGRDATMAMVGRTLLRADAKAAALGDRFETDGTWIRAQPLDAADTTGLGGVRVGIGRWRSADDLLCMDAPGLDLSRQCFRTEQWGDVTFRLVADRTAAVTTMVSTAAP